MNDNPVAHATGRDVSASGLQNLSCSAPVADATGKDVSASGLEPQGQTRPQLVPKRKVTFRNDANPLATSH